MINQLKTALSAIIAFAVLASNGCGDDNSPTSSSQFLLMGTWIDADGNELTFNADRT